MSSLSALEAEVKRGKEERSSVQKRTFTKWVNSHLVKKGHRVADLFVDLRDGSYLLELLQLISGEGVPRPEKAKVAGANIVKTANVGKALAFVKSKINIENIGPNDIVEGNPVLTMGLIWTIILRFEIQDISVDELSAKDALLLWVKKKTKGYPGVNVNDFHKSFRDGLAFNALIHAHRPDLVNYDSLKAEKVDDWLYNLSKAFSVCENRLGIMSLLEPGDVAVEKPDERSIMTYVAALYHYFSSQEKGDVAGQRVSSVISELAEIQALEDAYELKASKLLEWINEQIEKLDNRNFPNTIQEVQALQNELKTFLTADKPPKLKEKSDHEGEFFNIQNKLRAMNRPKFKPKEGRSLHDINKAWAVLETAEYDREAALNQEITRLRKLEEQAKRFNKKADILDSWMEETEKLVNKDDSSSNSEASLKKLEALLADVSAHEDRFGKVILASKTLDSERYHSRDQTNQKGKALQERWKRLNSLLLAKRDQLLDVLKLQHFFNDVKKTLEVIRTTQTNAASQEYGADAERVEDLLQKHKYLEHDITGLKEKVSALRKEADKHSASNQHALEKTDELVLALKELEDTANERKVKLQQNSEFLHLQVALDDEEIWVNEREHGVLTTDYGKDQTSAQKLIKENDVLLSSIISHEPVIKGVFNDAKGLIASDHPRAEEVEKKLTKVEGKWQRLHDAANARREKLEDFLLALKYHSSADDAEQYIREQEALLANADLGKDEESVRALLEKQNNIADALASYQFNINALSTLSKNLIQKGNVDSANIQRRQEEIEKEWEDLRQKSAQRSKDLEESEKFHKFNKEADEIAMWLDDKEVFVKESDLISDLENLEALQRRFDELERELAQKEAAHQEISKIAQKLVDESSHGQDIREKNDRLAKRLADLSENVTRRKQRIKQAHQASGLINAMNDLQELIRQKEKAASSDDYGRDLPSVAALKKKQEALARDIDGMSDRVSNFGQQIQKHLAEDPSNHFNDLIKQKHQDLADGMRNLEQLAAERSKKLAESYDLQKFKNDTNEALDWLGQKKTEISNLENPKDIRSIEAALRKLEKTQKATEGFDERLQEIEEVGKKLVGEGHSGAEEINGKIQKLKENREDLGRLLDNKDKELRDLYDLEKFKEDANDAKIWVAKRMHEAQSEESPKDEADAQRMLKKAEELRAEIDASDEFLRPVHERGRALVEKDHPEKEAIAEVLGQLTRDQQALVKAVDDRERRLKEALSLMNFNREAQEVEDWLDEAEAVTSKAEKPESLEAIEELMKRHEALRADARLEAAKVKALSATADQLIAEDHQAKGEIGQRRDAIMDRWNGLEADLVLRRRELEHAARLQQYLHDAEELEGWMRGKEEELQAELLASEALDPKEKARKQEEFDLAITARKKKLEDLRKELRAMEDEEGFDPTQARERFNELEALFAGLQQGAERAAKQLKEAALLQQADRGFDDLEIWFKEVEAALAIEDTGADLTTAQALLKKHALLEADIAAHEAPVGESARAAQALVDAGHSAADALRERREQLLARYAGVQAKAQARRAKLEASLRLQKYLRQVDEEGEYARYKTAVASSQDLGKDLVAAQKLLERHRVLADELAQHEQTTYAEIRATGQQLISSGEVSAEQVTPALEALDQAWANLKALAAQKDQVLQEHVRWLDFKGDQEDELRWIEQQIRALEGAEPAGESLTYCKALVKKHDTFLTELKAHEDRAQVIASAGTSLAASASAHSQDISDALGQLQEKLTTLGDLAQRRQQDLAGALERLVFAKEASEVEHFISDHQALAAAQPPATELASAQRQLEELDRFDAKAQAAAARVTNLVATKDSLVGASHPDHMAIQARCGAVVGSWEDFSSRLSERRQTLTEQVARFREADEKCLSFAEQAVTLNSWLDNAAEDLSEPVTVNSVEAAQKLELDHQRFQGSFGDQRQGYDELEGLDRTIRELGTQHNPYTPFTMGVLSDKWQQDATLSTERSRLLDEELARQAHNDALRHEFAKEANHLADWMESTRASLLEASNQTLERQLEDVKAKNAQIKARQAELGLVQQLATKLEAALIYENRYTEHSAISLSQKLEALKQIGTSMEHNIEQKIIAKNNSGISEEKMKEWSETFDYFDKGHKGVLDKIEFKSCLRGCGFEFKIVSEKQRDEEFEQILAFVDSNRNGTVSKQEFIDFMISQRKTTASSAEEVVSSFMMISQDKPIVTEEQLRASLPPNQVDYCLKYMEKVDGGYNYKGFVDAFFASQGLGSKFHRPALTVPKVETWGESRDDRLKEAEEKRRKAKEKADALIQEQQKRLAAQKVKREDLRSEMMVKTLEEAKKHEKV